MDTIKQCLSDAIAAEDKHAPLSDDALAKIFNDRGLPIARRTVAKYREQMGIPVARLRRALLLLLIVLGANSASAQMSYYDSIIAARLAKAEKMEKAKKAEVTPPKPPSKGVPSSSPLEGGRGGANNTIDPKSPSAALAYMVPMWYDAFPSNRVNPHGRTKVDMLPDEINIVLIRDSADFCFPVKDSKTSPYGWRWHRGHHGVDIRLRTGEPIHAAFGGTVRVAARMGGYGNCVVLRHPNGLETLYGHLSKINVRHGQQVAAGEVIGLGGSTGNSTGPHLHFECRFLYQPFDPEWILDFNNYGLRTRRLHLDKSYFGIRKPRKGEDLEYKADSSKIRESKKNRKAQATTINHKDF